MYITEKIMLQNAEVGSGWLEICENTSREWRSESDGLHLLKFRI